MWKRAVFGVVMCCAAVSTAHATTGLAMDGTKPQRFVISSQTQLTSMFDMFAEDNFDRRITGWAVDLVTQCTPTPAKGNSWDVTCVIEDLSLSARPFAPDAENLIRVVEEWDRMLTGATVVYRTGANGRITAFTLKSTNHQRVNDRVRKIQENMRQMLTRPFAALDIELPAKGDDKGKPWKVRSSMLMDVPSATGNAGGMDVRSQVTQTEGAAITIETSGKGVRGPAIYGENGQIQNAWEINLFSSAVFDSALQTLTQREILAQGSVTSSSLLGGGANAAPYVQTVKLTRLADGEAAPTLGENGIL